MKGSFLYPELIYIVRSLEQYIPTSSPASSGDNHQIKQSSTIPMISNLFITSSRFEASAPIKEEEEEGMNFEVVISLERDLIPHQTPEIGLIESLNYVCK